MHPHRPSDDRQRLLLWGGFAALMATAVAAVTALLWFLWTHQYPFTVLPGAYLLLFLHSHDCWFSRWAGWVFRRQERAPSRENGS